MGGLTESDARMMLAAIVEPGDASKLPFLVWQFSEVDPALTLHKRKALIGKPVQS